MNANITDSSKIYGWAVQAWDGTKHLLNAASWFIPSCVTAAAIATPIALMASMPFAEGREVVNLGNSSFISPCSPEIGFPETAATCAAAGMHLLGSLGAAAHVLRNNKSNELEDQLEDQIEMDDEDFYENAEMHVETPMIIERSDLSEVPLGAVALWAKQTGYTSVLIASGQKLMGAQEISQNITHAGIVSRRINNTACGIQEILGMHESISENVYHQDELNNHDQMLFFSLEDILPPEEKKSFHYHLLNISNAFIERMPNNPNGNYNFQSIKTMPFVSYMFATEDWDRLLYDLMEYRAISADALYVSKHREYFCSEFVLNNIQLSRLMQKYPEIVRQIESVLEISNVEDRKATLQMFRQQLAENGVLAELAEDPFFFLPSSRAMPAALMEFALRHHLPISRVSNPNLNSKEPELEETLSILASRRLHQRPLSEPAELSPTCKTIQELDYYLDLLEKKWRNNEVIDEENPSLLCLVDFFLRHEEFLGYSKDTLKCMFSRCFKKDADQIPSCVGSCIEQTFTWREMIRLALTSIAIDHTLDRLIENGQMAKVLDVLVNDPQIEVLDYKDLIELLFPVKEGGFFDISRMENYFIQLYLDRFLNEADIYKYGPLGFLGMEDIFKKIGWEVVSPIDRLRNFSLKYLDGKAAEQVMDIIQKTILKDIMRSEFSSVIGLIY